MKKKPTYEDLESRINDLESKLEKFENNQDKLEIPDYKRETLYLHEQEFKTLVENAPDIIFRFDHAFRHTYVNAAVEKATGIPKQTFIGKDHRELGMPEDIVLYFQKNIRKVFESGQEIEFSFSFPTPTGEHHYESRYVPEFTKDGTVEHVMGISRDVTESKQVAKALKESEERIRTILETEPECVKILDLNGKLEYMNPAGLNMIDADNMDQVLGQSMLPLITGEYRRSFAELISKTLKGNGGKLKFEAIGLRGRHVWLETTSVPLRQDNEKIIGVLGLTRDITEYKKAEDALKESEKHLKELNATKDKFFSIIAHDLRSPFNNILGFSELLIENVNDFGVEDSEKYLSIINSSAKNTLILLDNILNWAKSQTGQISFKPEKIIFSDVILEIIQLNKSLAKTKNISLNYFSTDEIKVDADENMLKAVLRNLISNAIKFTKSGGHISVSAISKQDYVEITISDDGIGMNKEKLKELFDMSAYTTTLGTANEKGSGLGLVLCKEFVEKHDGKIWVESEEGKGSDFKFTLPLNKS
ncbi:MAG: PAS domain-containing sensor histidine kinase [Bacteroidota bacterium]